VNVGINDGHIALLRLISTMTAEKRHPPSLKELGEADKTVDRLLHEAVNPKESK